MFRCRPDRRGDDEQPAFKLGTFEIEGEQKIGMVLSGQDYREIEAATGSSSASDISAVVPDTMLD